MRILLTRRFEISLDRPNFAHCDTVVKEAMAHYRKIKSKYGVIKWHFVKTSVVEKLKKYSGGSE